MLFLIFLCLCLFTVSPADSSGLSCGLEKSKTIYLIDADVDIEPIHKGLNEKFKDMCKDFYKIQSVSKPSTTIGETLELIGPYKSNVVNLFAVDYYNYASKVSSELVYAGDIMYKSTSLQEPDTTPKQAILVEDCKRVTYEYEQRIAKVASKGVASLNYGDLVDFISSIQYFDNTYIASRSSCVSQATKTSELKKVLICTDAERCFNDKKPRSDYLDFIYKSIKECSKYIQVFQNNILALIAPRPFEMDNEISIPTIFYETPYMNSEYLSQFPNSMNLISGLLLKYAFMKIINEAGWTRVAIISDVSPYSTDFEKEILEIFHEKQIIYNVQQCERAHDFEKAVLYLMKVDARIIIANVDKDNAEKLAKIILSKKYNRFTILYRVSPFGAGQVQRNWISITLGASENGYETCIVKKNSECSGIMQGINIVDETHAKYLTPENLNRANFYRKFAKTMKTKRRPGSTAYVKSMSDKLISKMHINENGEFTNVNPNHPAFNEQIPDQKKCYAKVNNFEEPCYYNLYLFIMFISIIFAITLLTITCFFHETSPIISTTYQQF